MNLSTKISNLIVDKKYNKWIRLFLILLAGSAYFIGALNFQSVEYDNIHTTLLITGSTIGILAGFMLIVPLFLFKVIKNKFGAEKTLPVVILAIVATVLALAALVIGSIAFVNK